MQLIGLTGGIGSGKSTVGRLFAAAGAVVIDADQVARHVVEPGTPALEEIVARFGDEVLTADGKLDRGALAAIVFADERARRDLEGITHPRIAAAIADHLDDVRADEQADGIERLVVLEHPLLIESGLHTGHEVVVVVEAPLEVRHQRLRERGMHAEDAAARMASQASDEQRRQHATHTIDNSGDLEDLPHQIERLLDELGRSS